MDCLRDSQGLLDAGTDRGATEIISGKPKTGKFGLEGSELRKTFSVAEIVLGKRTRPDGDVGEDGILPDGEKGRNLAMDKPRELFWREGSGGGIGCAADKARE